MVESSVVVESEEDELSGATVSPIEEPKTRFKVLFSSATPSKVNVELLPFASGAK